MTDAHFDSKAYALAKAVRAGDAQAVHDALDSRADVNWRDSEGKTPLHHAVENGNAIIIDALLRNGADMLARDIKERVPSALGFAAALGKEDIVKTFIAAGAAPREAEDALNLAAENKHVGTVKILLGAGFDVDFLPTARRTPLMLAASNGDIPMMETLLAAQADMHATDMRNFTALHWAALAGKADAAKFLVERGADEWKKTIHGYTPKMIAEEKGFSRTFAVLQRAPSLREDFAAAARQKAEAEELARKRKREEALGVFKNGAGRHVRGKRHPASFRKHRPS